VKPPHSAPLEDTPLPLLTTPDEPNHRVDLLPVGSFVKATGEQREVDGRRWIGVTAGRNKGWVPADLVEEHSQGDQYQNGGRHDTLREKSRDFHREFRRVTVYRGDNFWAILKKEGLLGYADKIAADNSHIPYVERWVRPGDQIYIRKDYYRRGHN
jgi:hypothetical protein